MHCMAASHYHLEKMLTRISAVRATLKNLRPLISSRPSVAHRYAHDDTTMDHFVSYNSPQVYNKFLADLSKDKQERLNSKSRFQPIGEREDRSDLPEAAARSLYLGKVLLQYNGVACLTGSNDLALYAQCFELVRPATVFEIGSCYGGTSLWMANTVRSLNLDCQVVSMDIDLSILHPRVKELQPDNLTFVQGDCSKIEETFTPDFLASYSHPWVIVEDAHVNSIGVLEHFHKFLKEGDYIIYDDTDPVMPVSCGMGMGWEGYPEWESTGLAKMNELRAFMTKYNDYYSVDSYITDMFGYNMSNNWNGYIRRMK